MVAIINYRDGYRLEGVRQRGRRMNYQSSMYCNIEKLESQNNVSRKIIIKKQQARKHQTSVNDGQICLAYDITCDAIIMLLPLSLQALTPESRQPRDSRFSSITDPNLPGTEIITREQISEADPDPWIRLRIIQVGSGSVWRDTNLDPGHTRYTGTVNVQKHVIQKIKIIFLIGTFSYIL